MTGSRQHERGSAQHWHRLLLAVAVVIRARSYLSARPLSHDEAALALNILERPFAHLLDRLDYTQAAPLGFLYLTKLATLTFGTGEHALRLLPFAASVGSVFLLFAVAKRLLPPSGVSAALALFAVSGPLVDYGVELKPYAVDACLTLALLLAFWTHAPPTNLSSTLRLGALGTAAVWLSYPAVFVLAGLGTPVLVDCLRRRDWKGLASIGGASMFWIANAAWLYLVSARPMATNPRVVRYWSAGFMPLPPRSLAELGWFPRTLGGTLERVAGLRPASLAVVLAGLGFLLLFARNRRAWWDLSLPALVTLFVSGLRLYPFQGRTIVFLAPILHLFAGSGFEFLWRGGRPLGVFLLAALLVPAGMREGEDLLEPDHGSEVPAAIEYARDHWRDGDFIYVYPGAEYSFRYYRRRLGFTTEEFFIGASERKQPEKILAELEALREHRRLWVIFAHAWRSDRFSSEQWYLHQLNRLGKLEDRRRLHHASLYLFSLPLAGTTSERAGDPSWPR